MAEEYREPLLEDKDGFCFIQNGTYDPVSNNETWERIHPLVDMLKASSEFYRLLEIGSEGEVTILLDEINVLVSQIGKMVAKIKRNDGMVIIPDAKHFQEKLEQITKTIENIPYKEARVKEKELAKGLATEFRDAMRKSIAHNYNETLDLNKKGAGIPIPADKEEQMKKIDSKVKADEAKKPSGKSGRSWNGRPKN